MCVGSFSAPSKVGIQSIGVYGHVSCLISGRTEWYPKLPLMFYTGRPASGACSWLAAAV